MGSKTPNIKEKKETCEVCNTKFVNLAGLVSHRSARHPELRYHDRSNAIKSNSNSTSRISKRVQIKKGSDVDTEESQTITVKPSAGKPTSKSEFKCPKCDKIFPINFQAVKHIQKKHSEDEEGNSLSTDSLDLIKPVPVEKCRGCNQYFDAETSHKCSTTGENSPINAFYCLGCDQRYLNLIAFQKHVSNAHNDNMDYMYFGTMDEFDRWKKSMEAIVKMKYLTLNKGVAFRYYSCNYVSTKNTFNTTYLCPSLIMAKILDSGIQIHYNKLHCEHTCPKYVVPDNFSKYLTNKPKEAKHFDTLIKKKEPEQETQQGLYKKYQKLMENVKIDAAKVDLPLLKKLFNSALKMQGLINSHDDEDHDVKEEVPIINKSITDDQITNILESKRTSARLKRKSDTVPSDDAKKPKVEDVKENKEYQSPKIKREPVTTMSPSFNDSYKQFLGSAESIKEKSKVVKRKEFVKTKIGQFSPKKKSPNIETNIDETIEKSRSPPNILKPSLLKQTNTILKDFKYEVREQENGCNILVLKI